MSTEPSSYLIDSNVLIAEHLADDSLHLQAKAILRSVNEEKKYLNILLVSEVATVLLKRTKDIEFTALISQSLFQNRVPKLKVLPATTELIQLTQTIFQAQKSAKLSFPDCSLIAQARLHNVKTILSFDQDLRKEFKDEFEFLPKKV